MLMLRVTWRPKHASVRASCTQTPDPDGSGPEVVTQPTDGGSPAAELWGVRRPGRDAPAKLTDGTKRPHATTPNTPLCHQTRPSQG